MMKDFVTIFTPTYNKADMLENLYQALLRQTNQDFEWIIVDDGSTDNTKELVDKFMEEGKLDISYKYKEVGGKHLAINLGLEIADGELFCIVDSENYLTDNGIELILKYWNQVKDDHSFVGVGGLKGRNEHEAIGNQVKQEIIDATSIDYRYKYKIKGDRQKAFRTEVLKKYKFPDIGDVKFITEDTVWNKLSEDGLKLRWFNNIICICDYRQDELTKNMLKNWKGTSYSNNEFLACKTIPTKAQIKHSMDYYHYGIYGGISISKLFKECRCKWISIFAIPLALVKLICTKRKLKGEKL